MSEQPSSSPCDDRLRLERDFFLRLLELGERDDLRPFLRDALALVMEISDASKGYIEVNNAVHKKMRGSDHPPRFWVAQGFTDTEVDLIRREVSSGIIAESLVTGRTVITACATEDPRFLSQRSVKALKLQAVLCAPIGNHAPVGVLYLQGRDTKAFGEVARSHAELFARHLAPLADRLLAREEQAVVVDHTATLRENLNVAAIAGTSRALAEIFQQVAIAAPVPVSVLITGESGTGKTALARAIHENSPRRNKPFVEVNCSAIPEQLFESELFGAEKGAHSTATCRIEGKIDAAKGGTLLLDEVGDIPLAVQGKLLMFLQSRRYYRLGSATPIEADVRVIAATNVDLHERVASKRFREDLFYRLHVLDVHMPPLRERLDDIVPIADTIVARIRAMHGSNISLSSAAKIALIENDWPGNIRQLENAIQRGWAMGLSQGVQIIEPKHLFPSERRPGTDESTASYDGAMRAFQNRFLSRALEANSWNVSETARQIGLARSHLNTLIRVHGLARSTSK